MLDVYLGIEFAVNNIVDVSSGRLQPATREPARYLTYILFFTEFY